MEKTHFLSIPNGSPQAWSIFFLPMPANLSVVNDGRTKRAHNTASWTGPIEINHAVGKLLAQKNRRPIRQVRSCGGVLLTHSVIMRGFFFIYFATLGRLDLMSAACVSGAIYGFQADLFRSDGCPTAFPFWTSLYIQTRKRAKGNRWMARRCLKACDDFYHRHHAYDKTRHGWTFVWKLKTCNFFLSPLDFTSSAVACFPESDRDSVPVLSIYIFKRSAIIVDSATNDATTLLFGFSK